MRKENLSLLALIFLLFGFWSVKAQDPGLVAHWSMNEGSGNLIHDATGRGHDGTIRGSYLGEWEWTEGIDGRGLHFFGPPDNNYGPYIFINGHADFAFGSSSFALEAWAKVDEFKNTGYGEVIMGSNWASSRAVTMGFGNKENRCINFWVQPDWPPNPSEARTSSKAVSGKWYHIVGVRNKTINKVQLFINGKLADESPDVSGSVTSTFAWSICGQFTWVWQPRGCFHGVLDEISIYRRALTAEEVLEHYKRFAPNSSPLANAGPDQTLECTSCCATEVTLDGTGSSDPDGDPLTYQWTWNGGSATGATPTITLPLGTTTIQLVVNDGQVDSEPDYVDITIQDTTPPDISVTVDPEQLWPPNHKMVDISATVTVSDVCDENPTWQLLSITSNEPEASPGKKNSPDIMGHEIGTPDTEFQLRAERLGTGTDRVYTIVYEAADASGNSATAEATVTVPHDLGKPVASTFNESIPPDSYYLFQNYPNPFNMQTQIRYQLPEAAQVRLRILNMLGTEVRRLEDGWREAGYYYVIWDGRNSSGREVASGVYLVQMKAGGFVQLRKVMVFK